MTLLVVAVSSSFPLMYSEWAIKMQHFIILKFFVFCRVFFFYLLSIKYWACSFTPLIASRDSFIHSRERHQKNLNSTNILFELVEGIKKERENLIFIKRRNKFLLDHAAVFNANIKNRDRLCDDDDDEFVISVKSNVFWYAQEKRQIEIEIKVLEFISILKKEFSRLS